jgi:hypothetical protein
MHTPNSNLNISNLKNILSKSYILNLDSGLATTGLLQITAGAALAYCFSNSNCAKKIKKVLDTEFHMCRASYPKKWVIIAILNFAA